MSESEHAILARAKSRPNASGLSADEFLNLLCQIQRLSLISYDEFGADVLIGNGRTRGH